MVSTLGIKHEKRASGFWKELPTLPTLPWSLKYTR